MTLGRRGLLRGGQDFISGRLSERAGGLMSRGAGAAAQDEGLALKMRLPGGDTSEIAAIESYGLHQVTRPKKSTLSKQS
eukprot:759121-Hanusia_phi.AAC.1